MLPRSNSILGAVLLAFAATGGAGLFAGCAAEQPSSTKLRAVGMTVATSPSPGTAPAPTPHPGALHVRWRYSNRNLRDVVCADIDGSGSPVIVTSAPGKAIVIDPSGKFVRAFPLAPDMWELAACRSPHGGYVIGFHTSSEGVEARDLRGNRLWRYVSEQYRVDFACPVDVNSPDGDAVAIAYNGGGVRLVSAKGDLLWSADTPGNAWRVGSAHLQRGSPASILIPQDSIHVYNPQGQKTKEIGSGYSVASVSGWDVDGDGLDEIVGLKTVQDGFLSVYGADGSLRWRRQELRRTATLSRPVVVGSFWPSGRQLAVGALDGTITLFDGEGKPLSFVNVGPSLEAFAVLEHGAGARDALLAVTAAGIVCYEWRPGAESPIPARLLSPPAPPREPPLIRAVLKNDVSAVKRLLAKRTNPDTCNSQGSQALVIAAKRGYAAISETLIDHHAHVNAFSKSGRTPLQEAAEAGHADMVRLLLARGADADLPDKSKSVSTGDIPLISAAMNGNVASVKYLLDAGADVNAQANNGTALHWAAGQGHVPVCEFLIARGASVDARTWLGSTPLMYAVMGGHIDVVKLLIAHGANVNARDDQTRRHYQVARFLGAKEGQQSIEKTGQLSVRKDDGSSVLDWAAMSKKPELIDLLQKAGAKPH